MHIARRIDKVNKTIRSISFLLVILGMIFLSYSSCDFSIAKKPCIHSKTIEKNGFVEEIDKNLGSFGDSKLVVFENEVYILATLDGILNIKKIDTTSSSFKLTNPIVQSNWLAAIEDNNSILCVTASFTDKSLKLYKIDMQSFNVDILPVVQHYEDQLLIDPTLVKVDDTYLITYTQINGRINNGDITKPNGLYEVILIESNDLINWKKRSSIVSENMNIEDGYLYVDSHDNSLGFLYEEELFDKKNSSIKIKKSMDWGNTWEESITLLSANADQEPAAIFSCYGKNYLYYSSDVDNDGSAYGAMAYASSFSNFNYTQEKVNVNLYLDTVAVLYDVVLNNDRLYFLTSRLDTDNSSVLVTHSLE